MVTYVCTKCKYSVKKEPMPKRCPYCGKEGAMQKAPSAQDLLNDTLNEIDDIEERQESRRKF
jgi:rRNA maturation endonuclease Nob1